MPSTRDMAWFKAQFHANVAAATAGTPFDLDMITALACQETGDIWGPLSRKGLPAQDILDVCVGDVITGPKRKAFPASRAALLAWPQGDRMYALARRALQDMAAKVPAYAPYAANPERFCHAFGILQYDLQFFKTTPGYFLNREYADIDKGLARAVAELKAQQARIPSLAGKPRLSDLEMAAVAIAYNTGGYTPAKMLKQGHKNAQGRYYGELFYDFLRLSRTVPPPAPAALAPAEPKPPKGQAPVVQPTQITATGDTFRVDTNTGRLMLRSTAVADPSGQNIVARLPDGHLVRALGEPPVNGFLRVETSLNGARFEGFGATRFLVNIGSAAVPVVQAATKPPTKGAVAVWLPHPTGHVTRRTQLAGPHSLNEPGQPGRTGTTPVKRLAELEAIIAWLNVENPAHRRYTPRDGLTFCNIYAHDFCHLAGIYLPRVWWTGPALVQLGKGVAVAPLYAKTVEEIRANALLTWLDQFGPDFGWRRTSGLTTLQTEANQGAVGLVVARRTDPNRPGHIAIVAPETPSARARRSADGEVISPVQSQAGSSNVCRRASANSWWTGAQFASHAFWLHG